MARRIGRRKVLAALAAAPWLTHSGRSPAIGAEGDQRCRFFFVVAADPQLPWGPVELWKTAIQHANRLQPAFMVVCGDLVHHPGNDEEAQAYLEVAKGLDKAIPLYNVAGNHDVHASPTPESLAWYAKHFGKPWYSFTHGGCLLLVLESDLLNRPEGAPEMADRQMAWLNKTLEEASREDFDHVFVFKHYPLCLKAVDEPDGYFNVPKPRRKELLDLFHEHNVKAVFSGHYHRNAHVKDGDLELITTSSLGKPLGSDPTGFRIVKVFDDRIEHRYYGYDDMPEQLATGPFRRQAHADSATDRPENDFRVCGVVGTRRVP